MANGLKVCARCHFELPIDSFGTHLRPNRIAGKRYTNSYCRECSKNMETPRAIRNRRLLQRYGISADQFDAILASQGGCAVCGRTESNGKYWHTDHDHSCCPTDARSCGKCIRGILCHGCNTALGNANDDPEILLKMVDYLRNGVRVNAE